MSGRSALVVGGTGYLGQRITDAFVRDGFRVAVLSRGQRPFDGLSESVERVCVDRHDRAVLQAELGPRMFDVVVDNVAFEADEVASLLAVLEGRVGHYLLTSSTAVYANRFTRRPIREDGPIPTTAIHLPSPVSTRQRC